jgi:hypothetical protein
MMRDPLATRVIGAVIGAFYLVTGVWSFLAPLTFFSALANFAPANIHLFHDLGAFQVGLGLALTAPVVLGAPMRTSLVAVLGASVLHLVAHIEDVRLGGHPYTDLPALTLICVALAIALVIEVMAQHALVPRPPMSRPPA